MKRSLLFRIENRILRLFVDILSDECYLKLLYRIRMGERLKIPPPHSFNEKLQWLKLYDRHPEYAQLVDKVSVKKYVSDRIGSEHVIPTLYVWDSVEQIDWNSLPSQFVLKVSSDSGGIIVCRDKSMLNINEAIRKLKRGWGENYSKYTKEYPYQNVKPRILAEEYMEDESGYELKDYKIFCIDGEPKFLFVASDRQVKGEEVKFDFFDLDWNHLPVRNGHPNSCHEIPVPKNFDYMLDIACRLSSGMKHVRVDLYNCNGKIYFGEMTFFHFSGMTPFVPKEWDYKFGDYLTLPVQDNA